MSTETSIFEDMEELKDLAEEILQEDDFEYDEPDADDYDYSVIEGQFADFHGYR